MSSLWFNLRLGGLFIQWDRGAWCPKFSRLPNRPKPGEGWVSLYELRWPW